jgi:undecaprenyl diphosphate synthase
VAVIMDGNGRWARRRGLPRIAGHRRGLERVRELVTECGERRIPFLTLFAFSSENWRRPASEVRLLMDLFLDALDKEIGKLHDNGVRFRTIGDLDRFGPAIVTRIRAAEALTRGNTALTLTVAANYGGRWDLVQAARALARRAASGALDPEAIDDAALEAALATAELPEPDLFIRTGGEQRLSNFLLWSLAYAELYFTPVLWPDFGRAEFEQALIAYSGRQRRFGRTGEQLEVELTHARGGGGRG